MLTMLSLWYAHHAITMVCSLCPRRYPWAPTVSPPLVPRRETRLGLLVRRTASTRRCRGPSNCALVIADVLWVCCAVGMLLILLTKCVCHCPPLTYLHLHLCCPPPPPPCYCPSPGHNTIRVAHCLRLDKGCELPADVVLWNPWTVSGTNEWTVSGTNEWTVSGTNEWTVSGTNEWTVSGTNEWTVRVDCEWYQ
jgi:hypothetical protein